MINGISTIGGSEQRPFWTNDVVFLLWKMFKWIYLPASIALYNSKKLQLMFL